MAHELPSLPLGKLVQLIITAIVALTLTFYDTLRDLFMKKKRSLTGKVSANNSCFVDMKLLIGSSDHRRRSKSWPRAGHAARRQPRRHRLSCGHQRSKLIFVLILLTSIQKEALVAAEKLRSRGYRASGYKCDVACRQSVFDTAKRIRADYGRVSIVVANAGVLMLNYFHDIREEEFRKTLDVNVAGPLWVREEQQQLHLFAYDRQCKRSSTTWLPPTTAILSGSVRLLVTSPR